MESRSGVRGARARIGTKETGMAIRIRVERVERTWQQQRNWNMLHSDPLQPNQYGYVDAELPVLETVLLLEQNLIEKTFDLAAIIKAVNNL